MGGGRVWDKLDELWKRGRLQAYILKYEIRTQRFEEGKGGS